MVTAVAKGEDDGCDDIHDGGEGVGILKIVLVLGCKFVGDDGNGEGFEQEENGFTFEANSVLDALMEEGNDDEGGSENDEDDCQCWVVFADNTTLQENKDSGKYVGHLLKTLARGGVHEELSFYKGESPVKEKAAFSSGRSRNRISDWKVTGFKSMK